MKGEGCNYGRGGIRWGLVSGDIGAGIWERKLSSRDEERCHLPRMKSAQDDNLSVANRKTGS
jgi:hypothetical protein